MEARISRGAFFHGVFLWSYSSQENVSICGAGKYSTFREDSRRKMIRG
jgi:hypothetical protein